MSFFRSDEAGVQAIKEEPARDAKAPKGLYRVSGLRVYVTED